MRRSVIGSLLGQGSGVFVHRAVLTSLQGDFPTALLLEQIAYWSERTDDADGWFFKTYADWLTELSLTKRQVMRSVGVLSALGLVETMVRRPRYRDQPVGLGPVVHYRLDMERLADWLADGDDDLVDGSDDDVGLLPNGTNVSNAGVTNVSNADVTNLTYSKDYNQETTTNTGDDPKVTKRPRPRDPIWDVLVKVNGGRGPSNRAEREKWNRAVKDLREADPPIDLMELERRGYRSVEKFDGFYPLGLVGNYTTLGDSPKRNGTVRVPIEYQERSAQADATARKRVKIGGQP